MKIIVVAATKSGSGKTTLTMGLIAAFVRRGLAVAPFKVGPDFIDPGHHSRIAGTTCRNLDGWMLPAQANIDCVGRSTAQVAVVEGVMGLFDGYDGQSEAGSTAQMAKWLGAPVLLVVDARHMARSAVALIQGFERFDPALSFAGVLFNYVASPRHLGYLTDAVAGHTVMPCLGGVMSDQVLAVPERHLGLYTREDHPLPDGHIDRLADIVEKAIDVNQLLSRLPDFKYGGLPAPRTAGSATTRIGVARDKAFCFYYQDNLDLLTQAGAELVFFSPLDDPMLPPGLDGLYLGGGYPELFAADLAANVRLRAQIAAMSQSGMPIYAECGGFMYLCRSLTDMDGAVHPMVGCFPLTTRMYSKLRVLGYREITLQQPSMIGQPGNRLRGHEFHYSAIGDCHADSPVETIYSVTPRDPSQSRAEGYRVANTLGSYIHLHLGSRPESARQWAAACQAYRKERS
jgi:cobyrinic acid a,c-diamide synthase